MIKKNSLIIFTILLFAISHKPALAHILQTDGTIGALMHIDPNDDPIANAPANFFFSFKDTTGKFQSENCDCRISIIEQGKVIYAQPAFQNAKGTDASMTYTLPRPDVYQIQIKGSPIKGNTFNSFTLNYNVRVERSADVSQPQVSSFFWTHLGHFITGIVILVLVFAIAIWNYIDHKSIFPKHQS